jgi:SET domain-containing protein
MFALDDGRVIDATTRGNVARYINHSCGGGSGNVHINPLTGKMEASGKGVRAIAHSASLLTARCCPSVQISLKICAALLCWYCATRQPNCMAKYFTIGGERKIIMLTLREISVGEELTYDYKFAREVDPNVPRIPCRCGSGEWPTNLPF